MRFLMKVTIPIAEGNAAIKSGALPQKIESILAEQKPEVAYFVEESGARCGFLVVSFQDPSQLPAFAEPWFLAFGARVELHPAMTPADLMKAGPAIERAVKKYA